MTWDQILQKMNATKAEFYPSGPIDDRNNTKKFIRIERDGSATARVFLDLFGMDIRERIIFVHYLRHRIKHFYDVDVGVKILSRDDPWDFGIELSTAERFNVEITSIADSKEHFKINKREERLTYYSGFEQLPFHEVEKLNQLFGDAKVDALLHELRRSITTKQDKVLNPFHTETGRMLVSSMLNPVEPLSDHIRHAIESKVEKSHHGKANTVLILDNRSSAFDAPDYRQAVDELAGYWSKCPFPEVWFYTGYCSDIDGNNAEFSFAPLKATDDQWRALEKIYEKQLQEPDGKVVW